MTKYCGKIAYFVYEPSEESGSKLTPVILLHPMTGTKELWDDMPQIIADKTKRKVYAYDARNHGESEYCDEFHMDHNIVDLFQFMDGMKIPKAILIGYSMGGITATHAALTKPERIEMVIVEDIFIQKIPKELLIPGIVCIKYWVEGAKKIPKNCTESEAVKMLVDILCGQIPDDHPFASMKDLFRKMKFLLRKDAEGNYAAYYNGEALLHKLENNPDQLMSDPPKGQFEGPTIFIYGGKSPFLPCKDEDAIKKQFPKAEFILFPEATHNIHYEFHDEVIATILRCLQTL